MLIRWQGWLAAAVVSLLTLGLVVLDLANRRFRNWWAHRALTTDTVAGMLVLLITVLVVDQVVGRRQVKDRSRAVSAQAAIVMGQAVRSSRAVSSVLAGSGDRTAATDEVRTYMIMLLVGAPVLIEARMSRTFLEQAQYLAAEMARTLAAMAKSPDASPISSARLDDAVAKLRAASTPLLQPLGLDELLAAGEQPAE